MSLDGEEVYTLWDEHSNPICLATLLIPKDDEGNYRIELRHSAVPGPVYRGTQDKTYLIKINSDLETAKTVANRLVAKYSNGLEELMNWLNDVGYRTDLND
tara:strand:+ start:207 stop:509 length:303 start_codon:yes stop_codon:yes gene_type:complete